MYQFLIRVDLVSTLGLAWDFPTFPDTHDAVAVPTVPLGQMKVAGAVEKYLKRCSGLSSIRTVYLSMG